LATALDLISLVKLIAVKVLPIDPFPTIRQLAEKSSGPFNTPLKLASSLVSASLFLI